MLFFENRRLKKEIQALETRLSDSERNYRTKCAEVDKLKADNATMARDQVELKKMVRDQIKADILVNALEAIGVLPGAKEVDFERRQQELRDQLARAQSLGMRANEYATQHQMSLQGMGGGLFGGVF